MDLNVCKIRMDILILRECKEVYMKEKEFSLGNKYTLKDEYGNTKKSIKDGGIL